MDFFLQLFWPLHCPVCGRPAVPACPDCLDQLVVRKSPNCIVCGGEYPCREHPGLAPHFFASPHSGVARDLVLDLKYRDRRIIGRLLGEALGRALDIKCSEVIVPVPLHRGSSRTFNQALEIARGLGQTLRVEVWDILSWAVVLPPQEKGGAAQRRLLPLDAISCGENRLRGKKITLVDDVRTTGTTLLRAKSALERCGGDVIAFVTWSSA